MSEVIRKLDLLKSPFRESIEELLRRAKEANLPEVCVAETYRTQERQLELYNTGYSKTKVSSFHNKGLAADFFTTGYKDADMKKLWELSKDIPYIVNGFYDLNWGFDKPHYQYDANKKGVTMPDETLKELKECQINYAMRQQNVLDLQVTAVRMQNDIDSLARDKIGLQNDIDALAKERDTLKSENIRLMEKIGEQAETIKLLNEHIEVTSNKKITIQEAIKTLLEAIFNKE